jgi:hypothetical protein
MRLVGMFVALVVSLVIVASAPGANGRASCNGVLVSSLAGQPGAVAEGTREFHQQSKMRVSRPGSLTSRVLTRIRVVCSSASQTWVRQSRPR